MELVLFQKVQDRFLFLTAALISFVGGVIVFTTCSLVIDIWVDRSNNTAVNNPLTLLSGHV